MERILVATDFSPHAKAARRHAQRFAEAYGADLHLLHVLVPYGPSSPLVEDFSGEDEAEAALGKMDVGEVRAERSVVRGIAAAPTILEYAEDHDVDLIVMGSHGRRGFRRLLLGSVTEEVLRIGRWPVLTVHREVSETPAQPRYDRILAPVDFSDRTARQLETTAELAQRFGATVEIVHVVDPPVIPELYMPIAPLVVDRKQATEEARARLESAAAPLREKLTVDTDVLVGGAVHEIVERIGQGADLVVMPTHGYSGLDRVLMGSVAEGVLRRSERPVLVLKAQRPD